MRSLATVARRDLLRFTRPRGRQAFPTCSAQLPASISVSISNPVVASAAGSQLRFCATAADESLVSAASIPLEQQTQTPASSAAETPIERRLREESEAKQRPDPAAMTSILDIVCAIADVKADYEAQMQRAAKRAQRAAAASPASVSPVANNRGGGGGSGSPNSAVPTTEKMYGHRRLIRRIDQRYLGQCVERLNELCELAVSHPTSDAAAALAEDLQSTELLGGLLEALSEAVRFTARERFPEENEAKLRGGKGSGEARVFSPWLPPTTCEFIGLWMGLRWPAAHINAQSPVTLRGYLTLCTDLFVGDVDAVQLIATRLCAREAVLKSRNPIDDAAEVLNVVTLAIKRLHIRQPDLSHLLSTLSFAKRMPSAQALQVLSSLCRVYEQRNLDLVLVITRRETPNVAVHYSLADCLFALRACMTLTGVSEPFVVEVLRALAPLCAQMSPREVAAVCHIVTMMRNSRRHAHVMRGVCARETRRLMPALLAQTKVHLKQFRPKDANYVLDCFLAFNVQHPFLFTQLAIGVADA